MKILFYSINLIILFTFQILKKKPEKLSCILCVILLIFFIGNYISTYTIFSHPRTRTKYFPIAEIQNWSLQFCCSTLGRLRFCVDAHFGVDSHPLAIRCFFLFFVLGISVIRTWQRFCYARDERSIAVYFSM